MLASLQGVGRWAWGCTAVALVMTLCARADPAKDPGAATAVDAVKGYWQDVRAGKVDEAIATYIDTFALADIAAGKDASVTRQQRESAAKDLQAFLGVAYKQPQVATALKNAEVKIKSEQPAADGITVIEYVVKVSKPAVELENTAYLRKESDGWRIVDTRQPGTPRLTETLHTGWTNSHQKLKDLTFDQYINLMTTTLSRKASGGGRATSKPAAAR